jgi:ABC-type multidrug transport system fused ATPase/permease subunit
MSELLAQPAPVFNSLTHVETIEKTLNEKPLDVKVAENSENKEVTATSHEIRKLFVTTATNEAVQGIFKVLFSPKKTIKIFWILSLLVTNGLNAYLVIQSILTYLNYGTSTSSKSLAEVPTLFPKITICK